MIAVLTCLALAQDPFEPAGVSGSAAPMEAKAAPRDAVDGWFVDDPSGFSGARIQQTSVMGVDGGTTVWEAQVRSTSQDGVTVGVGLPVSTFRSLAGRDTGLGNLNFLLSVPGKNDATTWGGEMHLPTGNSWTFAHRIDQTWRGSGAKLFHARRYTRGDTTWLARFSGGIGFTGGWEPVPPLYGHARVTIAVDQGIGPAGLMFEASGAYWDVSPLDVSALTRVDLGKGLRARGGVILPLASYIGGQPAFVGPGAREVSLVFDLRAAL